MFELPIFLMMLEVWFTSIFLARFSIHAAMKDTCLLLEGIHSGFLLLRLFAHFTNNTFNTATMKNFVGALYVVWDFLR